MQLAAVEAELLAAKRSSWSCYSSSSLQASSGARRAHVEILELVCRESPGATNLGIW